MTEDTRTIQEKVDAVKNMISVAKEGILLIKNDTGGVREEMGHVIESLNVLSQLFSDDPNLRNLMLAAMAYTGAALVSHLTEEEIMAIYLTQEEMNEYNKN